MCVRYYIRLWEKIKINQQLSHLKELTACWKDGQVNHPLQYSVVSAVADFVTYLWEVHQRKLPRRRNIPLRPKKDRYTVTHGFSTDNGVLECGSRTE